MKKLKLVVVLGPTASGKTRLAVELARQFNGEIVSADSRQVYSGMDIGTGKDLAEYDGIKYHVIDVADPRGQFSVAEFKKLADAAIFNIAKRGHLPMLVGGSGLYLQAVVDNFSLEQAKGLNAGLRAELETKNVDELLQILMEKNRTFAERLNNSDKNNKRRLIRYLEIENQELKAPVRKMDRQFDVLVLGLMPEKDLMEEKIKKRLIDRLEKEDMVAEVESLRKQGVSDKRLKDFGLEYKFITEYLEEKYSYDEMIELLNIAIRQFAKRQISWLRRWEKQGQKIIWLQGSREGAEKIKEFLN